MLFPQSTGEVAQVPLLTMQRASLALQVVLYHIYTLNYNVCA
jgi:hypothetical protein